MTMKITKIRKFSQTVLAFAVMFGIAFFSTEATATNSNILKITGTLPECTYPQKRGGGACLEKQNAKSCLNTTPFSPIGKGVTSEMCARGKAWCDNNDPRPAQHKRCKNVYAGNPPKNHEGYDYSAACGTSIFAPCDGTSTYNASSSTKPIKFKCDPICGKNYEFTFHHTQGAIRNGKFKKGELIGRSGNATGYACHMHIEIRQNGVILDPMNPGFDDEVCSCMDTEKVNRLECFNGQFKDDGTAVNTGYEDAPLAASTALLDHSSGYGASDPDCVYATVIASYEQAGCFFCKPFLVMFNAASRMAKVAYDKLAGAVKIVVIVAFAVWLAFNILKFISSFEIKEPRMLINLLINQSFRVLLVILLLSGPIESILNMTLDPVFLTGLKIAQLGGGLVVGENPAECNLGDLAVIGSDQGGLSPDLGNGIICTIKSIQDQIMDLFAVARVSWCLAWEATTMFIIPHFGYLLTAIVFFIAALLILFIYPFLLVDSILKMAVAISIFPAALGAFAFKSTSQYLQKVWNIFLNAIFTFIFLTLIILIITTIAKQEMNEIITEDIKNGMLANILWWTVGAAKILFVLFLGWAVLSEAKSFADKFAESIQFQVNWGTSKKPVTGIGLSTGSSVGAATKWVGKKTGKMALKGGKFVGNIAKEKASFGMKKFREDHKDDEWHKKLFGGEAHDENGEVMKDEKGNTMYEDNQTRISSAWNRILDKGKTKGNTKFGRALNKVNDKLHSDTSSYRSFERDENGNVMETVTKKNRDGSTEVTRSDAYGSITERTDADGKKSIAIMPNRALGKIAKKNGKVDRESLRAFQQNSLFTEKEKNVMVMNQLINARMDEAISAQLANLSNDGEREITSGVDENGNAYINISQTNSDGSTVTYTANFSNDHEGVMTSVEFMDQHGAGVAFVTDGIIQRKTEISLDKNGNEVRNDMYSVSGEYLERSPYPVFSDGKLSGSIPKDEVMFSQEDLKAFGNQVLKEGNNAYTFTEFR